MSATAARQMTAKGYLAPPPTPHHYEGNPGAHEHALRFGMWLFLATEILLFAGLFVGYATFRTFFPEAFDQAARHLSLFLGTLNTLLLLTSSLTVALAHHNAEQGKNRNAFWLLLVSIRMNAASRVAAAAKAPSDTTALQPWEATLMNAYTRAAMPAVEVTAPARSKCPA